MLAVDALMADPGDLFGQPLHQLLVDGWQFDPLHARNCGIFDPQLAGLVDQDSVTVSRSSHSRNGAR